MSTSSPTRSASSTTEPVCIALGSNLGDRAWHLRRALHELGRVVRLVRISSVHETAPVDGPAGSPDFLNMVVTGLTRLPPHDLLRELLAIEARLGRVRTIRNAPRVIDLDLIFYGARRIRTPELTVPHPRYHEREFVLAPLREISAFRSRR
ncbi:MAG TPA: 2-amino-4-hydroxy-6-hydroxymethyldihydropteridine diphosphokinase [Thermoanaerobaculia bacterium]|nr:2-amino-4-hydroxy-6-hydroxymethyldihydropteridine diphosphokinase [Thermoanaerobaculia bacterium]